MRLRATLNAESLATDDGNHGKTDCEGEFMIENDAAPLFMNMTYTLPLASHASR